MNGILCMASKVKIPFTSIVLAGISKLSFVDVCVPIPPSHPTGNSREAGEGESACDLHTGHVAAAGVQISEAVVVVGGSVRAESAIGAHFCLVQGDVVAVADSQGVLHPGDQQHGGRPGLELDGGTHSVA